MMAGYVRHPFTPEQVETFNRLLQHGWFWTYSLDPNGRECRELHKGGGLSDELPYAPLTLPIYQIQELPEV
jgi:hypothetical protein